MADTESYPVTNRNRLRRMHDRGHYDHESVYAILDAAMLCHIAYVIDGQPYCTPTAFWREGNTLMWHGSSASRMLRSQASGVPVCLTVTHMDAIVLARCGFNHSINYRSVMAFGHASLMGGEPSKLHAMDAFLDRYFPGRARAVRAPTAQEVKATSFVSMEIEDASAKIRALPVHDEDEDYAVPCWTELLPVTTTVGVPVACERQHPEADRARDGLAAWRSGRRLDEIFTETAANYA